MYRAEALQVHLVTKQAYFKNNNKKKATGRKACIIRYHRHEKNTCVCSHVRGISLGGLGTEVNGTLSIAPGHCEFQFHAINMWIF